MGPTQTDANHAPRAGNFSGCHGRAAGTPWAALTLLVPASSACLAANSPWEREPEQRGVEQSRCALTPGHPPVLGFQTNRGLGPSALVWTQASRDLGPTPMTHQVHSPRATQRGLATHPAATKSLHTSSYPTRLARPRRVRGAYSNVSPRRGGGRAPPGHPRALAVASSTASSSTCRASVSASCCSSFRS